MLWSCFAVASGTCRSKAISLTANGLVDRKRGLFAFFNSVYENVSSVVVCYTFSRLTSVP